MDALTWRGARLAARIDRHVGERIRRRRTMLGHTQEQLAAALEISYQQVQKYETGANRVSAGRLYQIAQRLEVSISHFFEGLDQFEGQAASDPAHGSNRATIELVRNFSGIADASIRTAVTGLVKALCERGQDGDSNSMHAILGVGGARTGENGSGHIADRGTID